MLRNTALVLLTASLLVACDEPMMVTPADAGPARADATRPVDGGFEPSMTYPGEGDGCDFSIFCGEFQLCVDGECVRHERFAETDLEYGEPVEMTLERAMESSLYRGDELPWIDAEGRFLGDELNTAMVPGPKGPIHLVWSARFGSSATETRLFVYGDGAPRGIFVDGLYVTAVTVTEEGVLWVAGRRPAPGNHYALRSIDERGEVVQEVVLPEAFLQEAARAAGPAEHLVYGVSSLLPWDEGLLFTLALGTSPPPGEEFIAPQSTGYGRLGRDGSVHLHDTVFGTANDGSYGWLVTDGVDPFSILTTFRERFGGPTTVEVANLQTGETHVVFDAVDDVASMVRYFQPSRSEWWWSVYPGADTCRFEGRRGLEIVVSATVQDTPCRNGNNGPVDLDIAPGAYGPAHTGNPRFPWLWQENIPRGTQQWVLGGADSVRRRQGSGSLYQGLLPVSRFGRSVEVMTGTAGEGVTIYELPLTRRGT